MSRTDRILGAVDLWLGHIESVLIGAMAVIALALGTMQVVLRYAFNTGFEWTEAYFVLATTSAMLLAGSRAVRDNAHVRVDIVHMLVPRGAARVMDVIAYSVSLMLCSFYVWCGFLFVRFARMMDTASPETGLKDWVVYSVMPCILVMFCLRYLLKIRAAVLGNDDDAHDDTLHIA